MTLRSRSVLLRLSLVLFLLSFGGCADGGGDVFARRDSAVDMRSAMCFDGIQNGSETDIDCGGSECPPCRPTCSDGIQNGLETDVDCGSPVCPACATCSDGIENGEEAGVDCGGSCMACPSACSDGIQNGDETEIDCGGSVCGACDSCTDGMQNGSETGIDCGGDVCGACPTCTDGIRNGAETGLDCGGPCSACASCIDGIRNGTETGIDCGGSCAACPSCIDGIRNGDEIGVDCGGSCALSCPDCSDGVRNGDETDVDCGGSCGPCSFLNTWRLSDGASTWVAIAPNETDAPRSPVLAAFDIEEHDVAYLLTASTYHVMTLGAPQRFTESGSLVSLFPELSREPRGAYSVPSLDGGITGGIAVSTADQVHLYVYRMASRTFEYTRSALESTLPTWSGPNAPDFPTLDAMWLALEDDEMWTACTTDNSYVAVLSLGRVHIESLGTCGGFSEMPLGSAFPPFMRTRAPSVADAAAAFYHHGALWLFLH